jgi:hypothetical protein
MLKSANNQNNTSKKEYNTLRAIKDWNRLVNQVNKKFKEQVEKVMASALRFWKEETRGLRMME